MFYVFWFFFIVIVYHYFIFPFLTVLFAAGLKKNVEKRDHFPTVTIIIAAYNEEKVIEEKIKNTFEINYPENKLEIIIVSDGSTDGTPDIVGKYKGKRVVSLFQPERLGKTAAINRAVNIASSEIVVFSDANSMYDKMAVKYLVRNFNDKTVGGVSGRKSIVVSGERDASLGDSLFWDFESKIKMYQSLIGSITTGDGEIFALRRDLYSSIPEEIINDDTAITFDIVKKGLRVVYEPEAISKEDASIVLKDDFNVKVRMVSGGYQTLLKNKKMLFPPQSFFAVQFISHKVLRWGMPFLLFLLLVANTFLLQGFYFYFFLLQILFYALAFWGYLMQKFNRPVKKFYYIPLYYCTMNFAALKGFFVFIRGRSGVEIWKKAER